jgi:tetratricopeptide (TPR) repeat protein
MRAAQWSLAAGNAALAGFGYDQAVAHLRRAVQGPGVDRVETLVRLGRAQRLAGDLAGSRQSFLDAAAQATRTADLVHAALGIGGGPIGFEVPIADDAQVGVLRRALATLGTEYGPLRAAVLGRLSLALTGLAAPGERRRLAEQAVAMADRCGDADVLVGALAAYCDAVAGPDYVDQRLDAANRMLAAATDHVPALLARRLRLLALLERGDFDEADREIDAYRWAANAVGLPLYQWLPVVWRGARVLMQGDVEAAIRYAGEAEAVGRRANSFNAMLLGQSLRMHAHLTAGTADRIVTEIRELLDQVTDVPLPVTYRAAPAVVLLAAGDPGPARSALRSYVATRAADIAADAEWLEGHWALADAAITLGDSTAAARLFADLRPYARLWAIDGIGAAVFGTISHQLGRLAGMLGQRRTAAEYLAQALADYERTGAIRLAAQVRTEAGLPAPADVQRAEGSLLRDGPVWRVTWRGVDATVPDSKGMRDLSTLLSRANQAVPAIDLAGTRGSAGSLGELLDPTARASYRKRLSELDADIAAGSESAQRERDAIAAELAAATGLHGVRVAGDQTDRARKAVTMRIRAAIQTIEAVHPALARHLRNAVKTGRLCAYEPDIRVTWRT